ncbi:carbohydrate porin [Filimonas effusa]|uniref:Carbohydrate porin n=1 Tax=Filimonas effusa TaxID=2508721 RepID=A0A4Q1DBF5_9BACT|nr:carbohydrate porin [Filimonas effusa]RXK85913.1 carbohydrate porin [Filimonas effusa]
MKINNCYAPFLLLLVAPPVYSQIIITNKQFSMGTTGRIGAGISPSIPGLTGRQLNLNGQGSLGSRLEQGDYVDLLPSFHFRAVNADNDSTKIDFQARLAYYSTQGTNLGNVNSRSVGGTVSSLPEAFAEVRNIVGSQWSAWAGARYMRYDDIHICDYFYFDDHSTTGFGVKYRNTSFSMYFPSVIDTTSRGTLPYSYSNIITGGGGFTYRQREIAVLEHEIKRWQGHTIKLLAEYHYVASSGRDALPYYPTDQGWVAGIKWTSPVRTLRKGSFNQLSVRYGSGVANGGDNGSTQTWLTFGAPDPVTQRYTGAYSLTAVEHVLLNLSSRLSLNGYSVFTRSKGGGSASGEAKDYYNRTVTNFKRDWVSGVRAIGYVTNWFHIISELHYAERTDGNNPKATMLKWVLAPTLVPTAARDPWARPHIRLIFSLARYNTYAMEHAYSPFLSYAGNKRWGSYLGVRAEWWIF